MSKLLPLLSAAALLSLSACGSSQDADNAAAANAANAAAAIKLPPMVKLSKTFRCKDNSLIFVDYMSDDKTANLRVGSKDKAPTVLTMAEAGKPYTAEGGYSVTGPGDVVTAELPGKGAQSCKS